MCSDCESTIKDSPSGESVQSSGTEGALLGNTAISEHLISIGHPQTSIDSMLKCGEPTGFMLYRQCDHHQGLFEASWRCNLRTCPVCARKRKGKLRERYLPILKSFPFIRGRDEFYFLTISPENYGNFEEGLRHIKATFRKFVRNEYFRDRVKGYLYVIETRNDKNNGWNIHIHAIFYGKMLDNRIYGTCNVCGQHLLKYDRVSRAFKCANKKCNSFNVSDIKDSKLVSMWRKCSGGQKVNIMVNNKVELKRSSGSCRLPMSKNPTFALNYMLKYISSNKDEFKDAESVAEYIHYTRKQKLVNVGGCFFKFFKGKVKVKSHYCCPICQSEIKFTYYHPPYYPLEPPPEQREFAYDDRTHEIFRKEYKSYELYKKFKLWNGRPLGNCKP